MSEVRGVSGRLSSVPTHWQLRHLPPQIDRTQTTSRRFLETNTPNTVSSSNFSVVINLLEFVVSVNTAKLPLENDAGALSYDNVTNALDDLLTKELQMEFTSLMSVDLQLSSRTLAVEASGTSQEQETQQQQQQLLAYSGTATFALESTAVTVNQQDVQDTAAVILQDNEAVMLLIPAVISIAVSNIVSNTQPRPSSGTSSTNYSGVLIALGVGSGLTFTIAIYMGYRYFKNKSYNKHRPPWECSGSNRHHDFGGGSRRAMLRSIRFHQEPILTKELPRPLEQVLTMNSTTSIRHQDSATNSVASAGQHQHYEWDDFSLEGISTTNSYASDDVATNDTQIYLANRRKEKRQQQKNNKKVKDLEKEEEDGGSDTDFSYDYIGTKQHGMDSKDDDDDESSLPMSSRYADMEHGSIEVGVNGNVVVAEGQVQTVTRGGWGTSTTKAGNRQNSAGRVIAPTNPNDPRHARRNIPSVASSLDDRPFDEAIPSLESSADPGNEATFHRVANVNPAVLPNNQPKEEEEEGLSSFLRGRQRANRVARALRDSTKE